MRNKGILIATIVFFLLINTSQFWERNIGLDSMLIFMILIFYFFLLSVILITQLFLSVKEKFKARRRLYSIGILVFVLSSAFFYPKGLLNFEQAKSDSLLIAQREGAANCMTTLKLKTNNKFSESNVCFGVTETTGDYRISRDTIFFENITYGRNQSDYFEFAIIRKESSVNNKLGDIVRFKNKSDKVGVILWIKKNELIK